LSKRAFITGINGQDGSYLARYLLGRDYEVFGIIRRNSVPEHQELRIHDLEGEINTFYGDMTDAAGLSRILREVRPDEIYNLAAQSHVRISFDVPEQTVETNALGTLNLLNAFKAESPKAKFYQASSSEMFGTSVDSDNYQRESTAMKPTSPYGCAKLFSYHLVRNYRKSYGLFAANGILFNHESPQRGSNFVTSKVVKGAVAIKLGISNSLEMGNIDAFRDWGHSKDYVRAMHLILNQEKSDDFVVATGQSRSVRDMCQFVFSHLGLNYKDYVKINPKYFRPEELPYLKGDASRAREILGWVPEISFEEMMVEMIEFWTVKLSKKLVTD